MALSPFQRSVWQWDVSSVERRLRQGSSPNERCTINEYLRDLTPMMLAVQSLTEKNHADDPNLVNRSIESRDRLVVNMLRCLVDAGADPRALNSNSMTALHYAALAKCAPAIDFLLEKEPRLLTATMMQGQQAYHCALEGGSVRAAAALLAHGQDVNAVCKGSMIDEDGDVVFRERNGETGQPPVHLVVQFGHLELLKYLVKEHGMSLDTPEGELVLCHVMCASHMFANETRSSCSVCLLLLLAQANGAPPRFTSARGTAASRKRDSSCEQAVRASI